MGRPREDPFWKYAERVDEGLKCNFCDHVFNGKPSISRFKYHLSGEPGRGVRSCESVPGGVKSKASEAIQESNKRFKTMPGSSSNPSSCRQQNDQVETEQTPFQVQDLGHEVVPEPATSLPRAEFETFTANNAGETGQDQAGSASSPNENYALVSDFLLFETQSITLDLLLAPDRELTSLGVNENFPANNAVETGQDQVGNASIPNEVEGTRLKTMQNSSSNEVPNPSSNQQNDQVGVESELPEGAACLPYFEVRNFPTNNDGAIGQDQVGNYESIPFPVEGPTLDLTSTSHRVNGSFTANNAVETWQDSGGQTFPTTGLVGQKFQINKEKVWECLMNDDISSIGIYGMGGSGKTTLMKHIHNQLEKKHIPVYWITVSQDFGIYRLQTRIAESIQLDLSNEREIFKRAAKLKKTLNEKQKYVLILDDLWDHFDLEDVGIPGDANGCKLVFTTRLLDVCRKMCCEEIIQVVPLNEDEAWRLFEEKFGAPLPLGVTDTAKLITMECDGLPLGIITMARSMRGLDDISEWRNALRKLKESQVRNDEMNEKVFSVLKFSYNRLNDSALQQCFLYCALYPEDHEFEDKQLIEDMIDEEIIREESMQAAFDEGHTILNELKRACLLESPFDGCLKMHDLIRDMAIQIIKEKGGVMVKAGAQLKEIPDCEKWTEDLLKVSLAYNQIIEIPPDFSPRCPKLSTLLLNYNWLGEISDSFFKQLNGLKVLNLSGTFIEKLPNSIFDLESLNVLLLSSCYDLHLPSLSKLQALKKLDLHNCVDLDMLPHGIEFLSNLRHLDLRNTSIEKFPVGILPKLVNLRVLKIHCYVKGEELALLRKLEILICTLDNVAELKTFPFNLNCYTLLVGESCFWKRAADYQHTHTKSNNNNNNCGGRIMFLDRGDTINPFRRHLFIFSRYVSEYFLSLSFFPSIFQSIQYIDIIQLEEENAAAALPLSLPDSTFSQLKQFGMNNCGIKKLFPPGLVSNFKNLELLHVSDCEEMEEIIATEEEHQSHNSIQFALPKLNMLVLAYLPNLKSICRGDIICNSLKFLTIIDCEELNRVPLSLLVASDDSQFSPLPSLEEIFIASEEWWERVELVHPNAKDILFPLVSF